MRLEIRKPHLMWCTHPTHNYKSMEHQQVHYKVQVATVFMEWLCEVNQLVRIVSIPNMGRQDPVLPSINMDKARISTTEKFLQTLSIIHRICSLAVVMEVRELARLQLVLIYRPTSSKFHFKTIWVITRSMSLRTEEVHSKAMESRHLNCNPGVL